MFNLMVSYNCGISYTLDKSAKTKEELQPRMRELDQQMLRWYVDQDGNQLFDEDCICRIHKNIFEFMNNPL